MKLKIRRITGKIEYRTVKDLHEMVEQGVKFTFIVDYNPINKTIIEAFAKLDGIHKNDEKNI